MGPDIQASTMCCPGGKADQLIMQIKTCTHDDISDLIEVATKSYIEHYTYLWLDNGTNYIKNNFNAAKLNEEISDHNAVFFLISVEQKFVGFIKLNIDSKTDGFSADKALELERIYFIKEASGKGLGKKALAFVKDFAKQKGKNIIWLKAMEIGTAIEFYKKQAFTIVRETYLDYPGVKIGFQKMFILHLHL